MTVFLLMTLLATAAAEKPPLPTDWHGTWTGTMVIHGNAKPTEVDMELAIAPIERSDELTWRVIYGTGAKKSVRDYKLVPDEKTSGRFRIDEQNGIVLSARLVGAVLFSEFDVNGSWLTARYELRDGGMRLEITSASKEAKKTGPQESVQGYRVETVQIAELKKKK